MEQDIDAHQEIRRREPQLLEMKKLHARESVQFLVPFDNRTGNVESPIPGVGEPVHQAAPELKVATANFDDGRDPWQPREPGDLLSDRSYL